MKVLLTGGAGYIGSQISYDLTDCANDVYIIDNLQTGNLISINKKAKFYNLNINSYKKVLKILKKNKIKNVIHLAASTSVEESMKFPKKYYDNNVINLMIFLDACAQAKIKNFIFASTCAVYKNTKNLSVSEDSDKDPVSVYGVTKYYGEELIKLYSRLYKFNYSILRFFNVIGSDSKLRTGKIIKKDMIFDNFVDRVSKKNYTFEVYGKNYNTKDGTCIRDYIHVEDISKIHISMLKLMKDKSFELNCGYGRGYSVLDIVRYFKLTFKNKIKIIYKKKRKGDIEAIFANVKKLNKELKLDFIKNPIKQAILSEYNWKIKIKSLNL
jgi:UDP-glucose 4-epimerase